MVKLLMELHHVSQEGIEQGKFRDGGTNVWALPCRFR